MKSSYTDHFDNREEATAVFKVPNTDKEDSTEVFVPVKKRDHGQKPSLKKRKRLIAAAVIAAAALVLGSAALCFYAFKGSPDTPEEPVFFMETGRLKVFTETYGVQDLGEYPLPEGVTEEMLGNGAVEEVFEFDEMRTHVVFPDSSRFGDASDVMDLYFADLTSGETKCISRQVPNTNIGNAYTISEDGSAVYYLEDSGEETDLRGWNRETETYETIDDGVFAFWQKNNGSTFLVAGSDGSVAELRGSEQREKILVAENAEIISSFLERDGTEIRFLEIDPDSYYYLSENALMRKDKDTDPILVAEGDTPQMVCAFSDGTCFYMTDAPTGMTGKDVVENDSETAMPLQHPVIDDHPTDDNEELAFQYFQDTAQAYYDSPWYELYGEDYVWFLEDGEPVSPGVGLDPAVIQATDWNSYYSELETYYAQRDPEKEGDDIYRQGLWEQIRDIPVSVPQNKLWYFDGKTSSLVTDRLSAVYSMDPDQKLLLISTYKDAEKMPLSQFSEQMENYFDVESALSIIITNHFYEYCRLDLADIHGTCTVSDTSAIGTARFARGGTSAFFEEYRGETVARKELFRLTVENGAPSAIISVSPSVDDWYLMRDGSAVLYSETGYGTGMLTGTEGVIGRDVWIGSVQESEDGACLAFLTGYNDAAECGTLVLYGDSQITTVERDVGAYALCGNGSLVYSLPKKGHDGGTQIVFSSENSEKIVTKSGVLLFAK